MTYVLKTPNPLYKGITEGVPFSKGIGQTDDKNVRNVLVNDYKYEDITDYSVLEEPAKESGNATMEAGQKISNAAQELIEATGEDLEEDINTGGLNISQLKDADGVDVDNLTVPQLKSLAKDLNLSQYSELTKPELIELINNA